MKLLGILIVLLILASAMISAYQHKPFELVIDEPDAKPANWPTNAAQAVMPGVMVCQPLLYPRHAPPRQIVRT